MSLRIISKIYSAYLPCLEMWITWLKIQWLMKSWKHDDESSYSGNSNYSLDLRVPSSGLPFGRGGTAGLLSTVSNRLASTWLSGNPPTTPPGMTVTFWHTGHGNWPVDSYPRLTTKSSKQPWQNECKQGKALGLSKAPIQIGQVKWSSRIFVLKLIAETGRNLGSVSMFVFNGSSC